MRKNQTSITAMGITVLRAVETEKPAGERICADPFAHRFLPGWFYHLTRLFILTGYAEWRGKGVVGFLVARERCIDDYLAACLKDGFNQVVILGAGYDSRAYRFEAFKGPVRVFEVDHPATQQDKLEKVRRVFGRLPDHVTYVPVDFNQQSLADCLAAHSYDPLAKSLFIWQGVTYYLEPGAVDATLSFISQHSAPGSSVIFDYIDPSLLERSTHHGEVKGMKRYRGLTGEDLRFGISLAEIEPFLNRRGFINVQNIRSQELKEKYFTGKNRSRNILSGYGIVSASVRG